MKIYLISRDAGLERLCRRALHSCGARGAELAVAESAGAGSDADVRIWDSAPEIDLGELGHSAGQRNLFLVSRRKAMALLERLPAANVQILLKPVQEAVLRAFFEQALEVAEARENSRTGDRDELLQSLLVANLKLQEYDHDRTNFLARAVHDFRAPLTAANGYCGLLLADLLGPLTAEQKEVLERTQRSLKRLSRMASAMFDLSVERQLERPLELRKANIEDAIDQALHEVAPFAAEKQLSITVQIERPAHPLYFEPGRIEQLLLNLLDNACKFTPRFGVIEIHGYDYFWERRSEPGNGSPAVENRRGRDWDRPNSYRVDVSDTGPGIPPGQLSRIFEEYTSYAGPQDRSCGGLGLAICKSILNAHHGRIWAEAREQGAMFSFVLPAGQPELGRAQYTGAGAGMVDSRSVAAG